MSTIKSIQGVHENIACSKCGMFPIIGRRYACFICKKDFCEVCDQADDNNHPLSHPLTQFKNPLQIQNVARTEIAEQKS